MNYELRAMSYTLLNANRVFLNCFDTKQFFIDITGFINYTSQPKAIPLAANHLTSPQFSFHQLRVLKWFRPGDNDAGCRRDESKGVPRFSAGSLDNFAI